MNISDNSDVVDDGMMLELTIDGQPVVLLSVDLSNQETLRTKMEYLGGKLLSYSRKMGELFSFDDHFKLYNVSMVVCGYFNIDFQSDEGKRFRLFMTEIFDCTLNDSLDLSCDCVDGLFTRYTSDEQTFKYLSFFSEKFFY